LSRILVIAAMWMAWPCRRFPRQDSRCTVRCPQDTSIGAVPLQAAKRSRLPKRDTSRTSPMTAAAMTGADPGQPGQAAAGRGDGNSGLLPGLAQPRVDAAQVTGQGRSQLAAVRLHRPVRPERRQDPADASCGDRALGAPPGISPPGAACIGSCSQPDRVGLPGGRSPSGSPARQPGSRRVRARLRTGQLRWTLADTNTPRPA
jgi:hypothetical protein